MSKHTHTPYFALLWSAEKSDAYIYWHKKRSSVQILICFIAHIFRFLKSSLGGMGALQLWDGPSTIVIVIRMDRRQKTIKSPSIPCWKIKPWGSVGVIPLEELSWNWQQWQIKWIKSITISRLSIQESSERSIFLYLWVQFTAFQVIPWLKR